jgi:hypothetical protein
MASASGGVTSTFLWKSSGNKGGGEAERQKGDGNGTSAQELMPAKFKLYSRKHLKNKITSVFMLTGIK